MLNHEEADFRIIPHLKWNCTLFPEYSTAIVVSKDTDILVLLVHYLKVFSLYGLKQLWMQIGQGDNKILLPIHILCERIGIGMCESLLKCHLGSGCDYLSKIGTKHSAMLAEPQHNLTSFGQSGFLDQHQQKPIW